MLCNIIQVFALRYGTKLTFFLVNVEDYPVGPKRVDQILL